MIFESLGRADVLATGATEAKIQKNTINGGENVDLAETTFNALKWRYTGVLFQGSLQFAVGIALARLLTPQAFGLAGMALIATGFGKIVGDFGVGAAIIQFPNLTHRHVRAAMTATMFMCSLVFVALWFLAPVIAALFDEDALVSMIRVIGASLIFSGMSVTVGSLLRREFQFRTLTGIESFSYAVGFGGVGISMAVAGYGAWSLVVANTVQPFCVLFLGLFFVKSSVWPYFGLQEYRDLFRVASAEVLNNSVNYAAENLPFAVIAKWLGASALGLYSRAFNLMDLPVRYFTVALSSVLFPAYARIQRDVPRLGAAFLQTTSFTCFITLPVFFTMASSPGVVIGGLFGEQWKPAATVVQILCLSGPFMAMTRVFGSVTHARGYVFSECGRQVIYFIIIGIALWFLLPFGLEGAAGAVTVAAIARFFLLARLSLRLVEVSWKQFLTAQAPACILASLSAIAAYVSHIIGEILGTSDILQLFAMILSCGACLFAALLLLPVSWFGNLYPWIIARFAGQCPRRFRRILMFRVSS